MSNEELVHVLDGYKVLDFTQVLAGAPTVTRLMAEMGAEIIKVELAPKGDFSRAMPFLKDGRSAYFIQQNRGKKSLCIDAKSPKGREILRAMVEQVDVLVENFAPGTIGRLGLGYDVVKEINPSLVMCSVSAFGQTGPLSDQPGYDYIAQAYAGVTHMIGDPDGAPSFPMLGLGDVGTGVHAMGAIACALLYRERTGKGQHVDISLLDSYFHCHEMNVQIYSGSKGAVNPIRSGSQHYALCPIGLFKGKETYLFIIALDHQWAPLCARPWGVQSWLTIPVFHPTPGGLQIWIRSPPSSKAGWPQPRATRRRFVSSKRRVCRLPPVLTIEQAVNHPHLRYRRTVRTIVDREFGELDIPGMPLKFSEFPNELPLETPSLGEHNEEILATYLSYTPEQVRALESEGILKRAE